MTRLVATTALPAVLSVGLAYWVVAAASAGVAHTAAAGMAELAVLAAVVDAGRRTGGGGFGGFNGRPPAF